MILYCIHHPKVPAASDKMPLCWGCIKSGQPVNLQEGELGKFLSGFEKAMKDIGRKFNDKH